jgi:hypothetical protein
MVKALIAVPAGGVQILNQVQAIAPAIRPVVVIDGLGAIVDLPPNLLSTIAAVPGVAAASAGALPTSLAVAQAVQPWVQAWNKWVSPEYQQSIDARPANWAPQGLRRAAVGGGTPPAPETLTDKIALGVVLVDGPSAATLALADITDIGLGVIHAIEHLYRNAPASAKLVFFAEQKVLTLTVNPTSVPGPIASPTPEQLEDREKLWRDPALQAMGFHTGFAGVADYRNALMARPWWGGTPQKAIFALFTKYNTAISAYAFFGRAVINLPQIDTYPGRNHIDRVIAHEICHLFEAQDEYTGCDPFKLTGPFNTPNGNCIENPLMTIGQTPCLMAGNSDDVCGYTKAQVGWFPFP